MITRIIRMSAVGCTPGPRGSLNSGMCHEAAGLSEPVLAYLVLLACVLTRTSPRPSRSKPANGVSGDLTDNADFTSTASFREQWRNWGLRVPRLMHCQITFGMILLWQPLRVGLSRRVWFTRIQCTLCSRFPKELQQHRMADHVT